jgi:FtsH-binding integral membrane protein
MAIGLALTGFVAFYVSNTPALLNLIFGNKILFYGLIIAELALVFIIARVSIACRLQPRPPCLFSIQH